MQYDVSDPVEYVKTLTCNWRKEVLVKLRSMLLSHELKESIEYKMLAYSLGDKNIFHLNAQKNYVSLYVGDTKKIHSSNELLAGLDTGKGCIRFKNAAHLELSRIDEFIKEVISLAKAGADIDC